uniref:Uncharacterized protein n=1 Tax=Anguilla anguilla TaxID=7936 RepID=A0A0E9P5K2_ANGAN
MSSPCMVYYSLCTLLRLSSEPSSYPHCYFYLLFTRKDHKARKL